MKQHRVEIYLDNSNEFRWRRLASNGEIVADSGEGYATLAEAHLAVFRVFGQPWVLAEDIDTGPVQGVAAVVPWSEEETRAFNADAVKDEQSW